MSKKNELKQVEAAIALLDTEFKKIISEVQKIKIGDKEIFPFGWRKAAKGRTVWRILEECLNQQLEVNNEKSKHSFTHAESEV
jgi:hypothetical protein